jgi:hypothetical protein
MTSVTRLEALIVVLGSSSLGENLEEKIDIVRTVQEEVLKHQMSPEDLDGFIADMLMFTSSPPAEYAIPATALAARWPGHP